MLQARENETGKVVTGAEAIRQLSAGTAQLIFSDPLPETATATEKREMAAFRVSKFR